MVTPRIRLKSTVLTDVTLYVSNPEAALAFYQLLGGSPDNDSSGMVWFGDSAVQLWRGDRPSYIRLSINVDNPSDIAAALTSEGHPVEWVDDQGRVFTTTDPTGNQITVRDAEKCWSRHG
jgi:predicted enzyme related to lactoylglutathione lyase